MKNKPSEKPKKNTPKDIPIIWVNVVESYC